MSLKVRFLYFPNFFCRQSEIRIFREIKLILPLPGSFHQKNQKHLVCQFLSYLRKKNKKHYVLHRGNSSHKWLDVKIESFSLDNLSSTRYKLEGFFHRLHRLQSSLRAFVLKLPKLAEGFCPKRQYVGLFLLLIDGFPQSISLSFTVTTLSARNTFVWLQIETSLWWVFNIPIK